jgi:hypothetical protein
MMGEVKGRALVVATTSDAAGVRSHATTPVDLTWKHTGATFVLTIPRGENDAKAIEATAAIAGAERIWLLGAP